MRNIFKKVIYLLFHNYGGTAPNADRVDSYRYAVGIFLLIAFWHVGTLGSILRMGWIIRDNMSKWEMLFFVAIMYFAPGYFVVSRLFPQAEIESVSMTPPEVRKGNILLFWYVVFSLAVALSIAIYQRGWNAPHPLNH